MSSETSTRQMRLLAADTLNSAAETLRMAGESLQSAFGPLDVEELLSNKWIPTADATGEQHTKYLTYCSALSTRYHRRRGSVPPYIHLRCIAFIDGKQKQKWLKRRPEKELDVFRGVVDAPGTFNVRIAMFSTNWEDITTINRSDINYAHCWTGAIVKNAGGRYAGKSLFIYDCDVDPSRFYEVDEDGVNTTTLLRIGEVLVHYQRAFYDFLRSKGPITAVYIFPTVPGESYTGLCVRHSYAFLAEHFSLHFEDRPLEENDIRTDGWIKFMDP